MHGDLDQHTRMAVLSAFKAGTHHVLVATDVAVGFQTHNSLFFSLLLHWA